MWNGGLVFRDPSLIRVNYFEQAAEVETEATALCFINEGLCWGWMTCSFQSLQPDSVLVSTNVITKEQAAEIEFTLYISQGRGPVGGHELFRITVKSKPKQQ